MISIKATVQVHANIMQNSGETKRERRLVWVASTSEFSLKTLWRQSMILPKPLSMTAMRS
jgi:hypothetical protein